MGHASTQSVRHVVSRIIICQFLIIAGLGFMVFLIKGPQNGLSLLGGAAAYALPTLIFARTLSFFADPRATMRFMIAFFAGEAFKLILSGALFLVVVLYCHANVIAAIGGLAVAIAAFWMASALCLLKPGVRA